jgi:hypothetical protein
VEIATRTRPFVRRLFAIAVAMALWAIPHAAAAAEFQASHFVEFRSRPGDKVGHTYIVYGRLDAAGRPRGVRYAGLYPKSDKAVLMAPRAAIRGGVRDDFRLPPNAVYRRHVTAKEFARVRAKVRQIRNRESHWNLLFFNCNDFAIEIAETLGLWRPPGWLLPRDFVGVLRAMNGPASAIGQHAAPDRRKAPTHGRSVRRPR